VQAALNNHHVPARAADGCMKKAYPQGNMRHSKAHQPKQASQAQAFGYGL